MTDNVEKDYRSRMYHPFVDSTQYLGGMVAIAIGAGSLLGWPGVLIALGIVAIIDIHVDMLALSIRPSK